MDKLYVVTYDAYDGFDSIIRKENYIRAKSDDEARAIFNEIAKTKREDLWSDAKFIYELKVLNESR